MLSLQWLDVLFMQAPGLLGGDEHSLLLECMSIPFAEGGVMVCCEIKDRLLQLQLSRIDGIRLLVHIKSLWQLPPDDVNCDLFALLCEVGWVGLAPQV